MWNGRIGFLFHPYASSCTQWLFSISFTVANSSSPQQIYFTSLQSIDVKTGGALKLSISTLCRNIESLWGSAPCWHWRHLRAVHSNSMCFTGASSTLPFISLCASIKANRLPWILNAILHISTKSKWPVSQLSEISILSEGCFVHSHCWVYRISSVCLYTYSMCVSYWNMGLLTQNSSKMNKTTPTVSSVTCTTFILVFAHRSMDLCYSPLPSGPFSGT